MPAWSLFTLNEFCNLKANDSSRNVLRSMLYVVIGKKTAKIRILAYFDGDEDNYLISVVVVLKFNVIVIRYICTVG